MGRVVFLQENGPENAHFPGRNFGKFRRLRREYSGKDEAGGGEAMRRGFAMASRRGNA